MTGKSCLAANHDVAAQFAAAADACLPGNHRMAAHFHIVCNLHQVVEFAALPDDGAANGGPVNAGVGAYFHIIFYHHIPGLRYFLVALSFLRRKAKSIGSQHGTGMNNDTAANLRTVVNLYAGIQNGIIGNGRKVADKAVRKYFYILADFHIFTQITKRCEVNIFSYLCRFMLIAWLFNTHPFGLLHLLISVQQGSKSAVCIGYTDERGFNRFFELKARIDEHYSRLGFI